MTFQFFPVFCTLVLFTACQTNISGVIRKDGMICIPGGNFEMGGNGAQARQDELPLHKIELDTFWMDETEVTNVQFRSFIESTGYITTAEKDFEFTSGQGELIHQRAGALVFQKTNDPSGVDSWWKFVEGANWKHPQGPSSGISGKDDYPVAQISWLDAVEYCKWSGKRLPTEAEWEYAARGGIKHAVYPWGDETLGTGKQKCNSWNGNFPSQNSLKDGYERSSPVRSYAPNGFGLYDMAGNVWEWCGDWYDADYYKVCVEKNIFKNIYGPNASPSREKVIRGGSFLCNDSYCSGFRVSARMKTSPETGLEHTGFRCVKDYK